MGLVQSGVEHPGVGAGAVGPLWLRLQGYPAAIMSSLLLAFTGILMRILSADYGMPSLVLAFWRAALVVVVLVPILLCWRPHWLRLSRQQCLYYGGYGLLLAVFNALWTLSVALNGAAVATILVYSSVIFTLLCGWCLYGERLRPVEGGLILLSLWGCLQVCGGRDLLAQALNWHGLLLGLLSGLGYGLYTLAGRIATRRHYPVWNTILYVFAFSALDQWLFNQLVLISLPEMSSLPSGSLWRLLQGSAGDLWYLSVQSPHPGWQGWALLWLLAAGPTLLGFGLYNQSLKRLPMGVVNLIVSLERVFTAVIAYGWLGEQLTPAQWGGALLVLVAILALQQYGRRRPKSMAASVDASVEASVRGATP